METKVCDACFRVITSYPGLFQMGKIEHWKDHGYDRSDWTATHRYELCHKCTQKVFQTISEQRRLNNRSK